MIKKTVITMVVIHIGERTHHHDHVILFNNLRVINTTAKRPGNPIPLEEVLLLI